MYLRRLNPKTLLESVPTVTIQHKPSFLEQRRLKGLFNQLQNPALDDTQTEVLLSLLRTIAIPSPTLFFFLASVSDKNNFLAYFQLLASPKQL